MPKIKVLSQHVADLIAAGEVVERPASVAKELVENAIDAGATFITVEIKSGGVAYLRVTDDGCGIARDDVPTAILRHSTSKIQEERDLEHIATLGFRGEALAAITAVSKMEIITHRLEDEMGTRLYQEGGTILEIDDIGAPKGTSIIVRELFYNTPARMKFLKKDASEGSAVEAVVTAVALSHPEISFQLIREGKVTLHTPGDGKKDSCVYSVLGRDMANSMLKAEGENGVVKVNGFITKPIASRGNRALQYFFVNGRYVKSKMLMAALEQAYANVIMKGRFPSCVLEITLPVELTDVNVHPTKTEIKFAREKEVFDAVYYSVKNAILNDSSLADAQISIKPQASIEHHEAPKITSKPMYFNKQETVQKEGIPIVKPQSKPSFVPTFKVAEPQPRTIAVAPHIEIKKEEPVLTLFSPTAQKTEEKKPEFKFIGEVLNTYIIVECDEGVVLIDKHAAHERILFEKLKTQKIAPQAQRLLTPVHLKLAEEETEVLFENLKLLESLGFEIDEMGFGAIAVRQVPDGVDGASVSDAVSEIVFALQNKRKISDEERFDEILHSIACKAAIKAGMRTDRFEAEKLAREVLSRDDIRYCPHGRPVAVSLTKYQLEKMFKRS